jgi:hypothetical protein
VILRGTHAPTFTRREAEFTLRNAALLLGWDRQLHRMRDEIDEDTWAAMQLLYDKAKELGTK